MTTRNSLAERLMNALLRFPRVTLILSVLAAILLASGIPRLSVTTDLRVYFSQDNPQLAALIEMEEKYRRNDSIFFLVHANNSIYEPACLRLIYQLTEAGWQLPFAYRSSSLSNYQYSRSDGETLVTRQLIESPERIDHSSGAFIRKIIADEPAAINALVAADESAAGVAVVLELPDDSADAVNETVAAARQLADSIDSAGCGQILLAGSATNSVSLGEAVRDDIRKLVVLSYLVITAGLFLLLRSGWATALIMMTVSLVIATTMGIFGWLGYTLSPTAGFVPSIVLTIAVADCVHIVSNYLMELGQGKSKIDSIRESLRINLTPVFITSVTTAIGVLSLNLSDSPPYQDLGNMVACGVAVAFFMSITALPAAILLTPAPKRAWLFSSGRQAQALADWIISTHKPLLIAGGVVVLFVASFVGRNVLTENWHEYFTKHFEIRNAVDLIDEKLGGIHRIYYDMETGRMDGIYDPAYASQLQSFSDWLSTQAGVTHTDGLHETLKTLNRAFHDNSVDYFRVPENRETIAQFLLLAELSQPPGSSVDNLIDQDRSATRFTVSVSKTDSETLLALDRAAVQWLSNNAPAIQARSGTGLDLIFAHITHRNIRGLLMGTALALAAISLLLMAVLRSVRLGLISLLPNLAPAALAYGLWGMTVARIDLALSVVICMSLGIVVDDSVHFVSKYLRARREHGLDPADGIRYAFRVVGMALVITSIVLIAGFGLLILSKFTPTRETGGLLALTIGIALVVDFFLLPPLLLVADKAQTGQPNDADQSVDD